MTLDLMHGDEHPILIVELQPTFDRVKAMDTWLAFAQQLAPTAKIHVAPAANGTFEVFARNRPQSSSRRCVLLSNPSPGLGS